MLPFQPSLVSSHTSCSGLQTADSWELHSPARFGFFSSNSKSEQSLCLQCSLSPAETKQGSRSCCKAAGRLNLLTSGWTLLILLHCLLTFAAPFSALRDPSPAQPSSAHSSDHFPAPYPAVGIPTTSAGCTFQNKKKCLYSLITARYAGNSGGEA